MQDRQKKERPHEETAAPESVAPLKKILTPEGEQPVTGMEITSYQIPQPGKAPQTVPPGGETLPPVKDNFVPEIEKLVTEMEGNPFTTVLAGKEIPPEDAGVIGTVPADSHQEEDHLPIRNTVSEGMISGGKETVTPVE